MLIVLASFIHKLSGRHFCDQGLAFVVLLNADGWGQADVGEFMFLESQFQDTEIVAPNDDFMAGEDQLEGVVFLARFEFRMGEVFIGQQQGAAGSGLKAQGAGAPVDGPAFDHRVGVRVGFHG